MDDLYATALKHGAFGGKLMGAGGGGFFFFLAPTLPTSADPQGASPDQGLGPFQD